MNVMITPQSDILYMTAAFEHARLTTDKVKVSIRGDGLTTLYDESYQYVGDNPLSLMDDGYQPGPVRFRL